MLKLMLRFNALSRHTRVCVLWVYYVVCVNCVCVVVVVVFKAYGVKRDFKNRRLRRQRTTIEEGDDSYSYSPSPPSPTWQLLDELRHVCGVGLEKTQQIAFSLYKKLYGTEIKETNREWKTQNVQILTRVSRFRKNSARIRNVENSIPKITILLKTC